MIPYDVISDRIYNDPMKLVQKYTKFALILTKKPKTRKVCDSGYCVKPGTLTLDNCLHLLYNSIPVQE